MRIYLDTSDYSAMHYAAAGSDSALICDQLRELAHGGQIEIGLSYYVVFELLQKAAPEHREDRLARARMLKDLCGLNAFCYPGDLGHRNAFSKDGVWGPRSAVDDLDVEQLVAQLRQQIRQDPSFTREQRRRLSKRQAFADYVYREPTVLTLSAVEKWPLPFGREFIANGDLRRYILGLITQKEANAKLRTCLTDPVTFYETWFEHYGRGNPLEIQGTELAGKLISILEGLQAMLDKQIALRADIKKALKAEGEDALDGEDRRKLIKLLGDIKKFGGEIQSPEEILKGAPKLMKVFGEKSAHLIPQVVLAFHRDGSRIRRSDVIDFIHAMYLPHTDLWRGDRSFSGRLVRHKVNNWERVVPTLTELPSRIEAELTKQTK